MHRRYQVGMVVVAAALGAALWLIQPTPDALSAGQAGSDGGPVVARMIAGNRSTVDGVHDDLARAVAWVGQRLDGRPAPQSPDPAWAYLVPEARHLLADQLPVRGAPARAPDPVSPPDAAPTDPDRPRDGDGSGSGAPTGRLPGPVTAGLGGDTVSGADVDVAPPPLPVGAVSIGHQQVVQDDQSVRLRGDQVFADMRYTGGGLDLVDVGAGHVVVIVADDPAAVRLDGGLVVPGRAYQLGSNSRLSGPGPAHVVIRPLGALPVVYAGPLVPPADG